MKKETLKKLPKETLISLLKNYKMYIFLFVLLGTIVSIVFYTLVSDFKIIIIYLLFLISLYPVLRKRNFIIEEIKKRENPSTT